MAEKGVSKDVAKKVAGGLVIMIGAPSDKTEKVKCPHCGKEFEPMSDASPDNGKEEEHKE